MERGMKDKAVAKLQEILKLDPGFCDAHILLGHTFLDDGKVDEAIGEFSYVIKCDPTSNDAKVGLGMGHAKKGDTDKALSIWSAIKMNRPKRSTTMRAPGKGDLAGVESATGAHAALRQQASEPSAPLAADAITGSPTLSAACTRQAVSSGLARPMGPCWRPATLIGNGSRGLGSKSTRGQIRQGGRGFHRSLGGANVLLVKSGREAVTQSANTPAGALPVPRSGRDGECGPPQGVGHAASQAVPRLPRPGTAPARPSAPGSAASATTRTAPRSRDGVRVPSSSAQSRSQNTSRKAGASNCKPNPHGSVYLLK
jgi:hypothetical protein